MTLPYGCFLEDIENMLICSGTAENITQIQQILCGKLMVFKENEE